jgi:osmotically-inducible protein OsmY
MLHDMDAKTAETGAAPAEIAAAAVAPIHGDAGMPSGCLVLVGADGAITLLGEVEQSGEREAVERHVRALHGARRVINRIAVVPREP